MRSSPKLLNLPFQAVMRNLSLQIIPMQRIDEIWLLGHKEPTGQLLQCSTGSELPRKPICIYVRPSVPEL